jgi:hypothetical protein
MAAMKPCVAVFLVWIAGAAGGMAALGDYARTPGPAALRLETWPVGSRIGRDSRRATFIMFAHPRCPCTRASLAELERILARSPGGVRTFVLFLSPSSVPREWVDTDLVRLAREIPDVTVAEDVDGVEARWFHAETSGHSFLFSPDGRLLFSGGITPLRGHEGESPGKDALLAALRHAPTRTWEAPVFGCPLFTREGP